MKSSKNPDSWQSNLGKFIEGVVSLPPELRTKVILLFLSGIFTTAIVAALLYAYLRTQGLV